MSEGGENRGWDLGIGGLGMGVRVTR